ncbi:hypothetical protein GQ464_002420 [Rhodocaloribacter litoris]|uniref:hypothetical protein n=1 Tax=Rhodocaloribacter litoris TaxID=2558931 RepID=UPI00141D8AD1|nr:hypothetical protein [Rhodocaloribacter litoris]QXD15823.1 hypothetical protein GQ464_002420 [Rhodocaloribacter litoris]GIV57089.1 MAG: hypothetical protein KatS3mg042_0002 [Rhodothermaceae bacterium]
MPQRSPHLIDALRETARRLDAGARYEWGHMGRCNCGHLVQTLTGMTDLEIVRAVDYALDEWTEHARDYCAGTGHRVDDLFQTLQRAGLAPDDLARLEYLSDARVLRRLPPDRTPLHHNDPRDAALYMRTLADVLEEA